MNTKDVIGENTTLAKIIDGSLTEFEDDSLTNIKCGFYGWVNLQKLTIPNVKTIYNGASSTDSVFNDNLNEFNAPKLLSFGTYTFGKLSNITTLDLPSVTTVGNRGMYECQNLQIFNAPNMTRVGSESFRRCQKLETVICGPDCVVESWAFMDCSNLTNLNFSNIFKVLDNSFNGAGFTKIDAPNLTQLGSSSFTWCKALESVKMALVKTIVTSSFSQCALLKKAVFSNVTKIESRAFFNDKSFETLVLEGNSVATLSDANAFGSTNSTFLVYVPDSLVEDYKSATNWSTYANRIKPISELPEEEETT